MNFFQFFTDPVLRAPTLGSMLMCLAAGLVGAIVFVRKKTLLGEALSHATFPGVTLAIVVAGFFALEQFLPFLVLFGAFLSSLLGFWLIDRMEKRLKVSSDAALAAILSLFFGIGVTIASFAQNSYAHLYRQMQSYLYGQAATMIDHHILIYATLVLLILLFVLTFYKEILTLCFDAQYAESCGVAKWVDFATFIVIVLAIVVGIRCVGVVLMSAMLIAPAAAARQFTDRLPFMFMLAALFGCLSAFLGLVGSVKISESMLGNYSVPTGPMIVLVSGAIALFALLFAPKRGLLSRYLRIVKFRNACSQENLLKALWRFKLGGQSEISFREIARCVGFSSLYLRLLIFRLIIGKSLMKIGQNYQLTPLGTKRGARIVRLHRLWEVYLVHALGLNVERVHKSAEEMEHILTPELEKKLTELLDNPRHDPHQQPIPEG